MNFGPDEELSAEDGDKIIEDLRDAVHGPLED